MFRWWHLLFPVPVKFRHETDGEVSTVIVTLVPVYHVLLRLFRRVVPTSLTESKPVQTTENGEHVCDSSKSD